MQCTSKCKGLTKDNSKLQQPSWLLPSSTQAQQKNQRKSGSKTWFAANPAERV
jgi:hypothetical protein